MLNDIVDGLWSTCATSLMSVMQKSCCWLLLHWEALTKMAFQLTAHLLAYFPAHLCDFISAIRLGGGELMASFL
jgi:hypothetical protein